MLCNMALQASEAYCWMLQHDIGISDHNLLLFKVLTTSYLWNHSKHSSIGNTQLDETSWIAEMTWPMESNWRLPLRSIFARLRARRSQYARLLGSAIDSKSSTWATPTILLQYREGIRQCKSSVNLHEQKSVEIHIAQKWEKKNKKNVVFLSLLALNFDQRNKRKIMR